MFLVFQLYFINLLLKSKFLEFFIEKKKEIKLLIFLSTYYNYLKYYIFYII